ncbi:MAG: ATP-binding protein, partial [Bacteroidota bacterium]
DKDWVKAGNRNASYYTNLAPGTYIFRVKGSNNDGVWNQEGISIAITISPPLWKTTWAYAGYIVSLFTLLLFARRYELNRQRYKHNAEMEQLQTAKLKEVDRIRTRFFANISHEFRTPLTLIDGPANQLASGDTKNARETGEIIARNSQRLLRLVNQLLDFSKFESGHMKLRVQELNVVDAVKTTAASFESLANRKEIQFVIHVPENPISGWIDRDALEKILVNLLSNAFKFTKEGGKVIVNVGRNALPSGQAGIPSDERVAIIVSDSGVGIPASQLDKIFDRFYQVDDTHTREQEGTGIGLALTKELVELHHGTIFVKSEPEKGSTFTVCLPLDKTSYRVDQIAEVHDEQPADQLIRSTLGAFTDVESETAMVEADADESLPLVLIIEDNVDMRRYIGTRLESNYRLAEAVNGAEGIKIAVDEIPDIIISDVMMPKMDGFEVCRKLKTDERTSHIPVILLTAKAGQDHKIEGLETGADDYLVKPFDAKELLVRVRNLVEQRKQLHERFQRELVIQPTGIKVHSADEKFLKKVFEVVERNLGDSDFDLATFTEEAGMSRLQLHRKLKAITGSSPGEFVRQFRLQRAADLLKKRVGTVSEIAYEVGFNNLSYFAKQFREKYGVAPSEFLQATHPSSP